MAAGPRVHNHRSCLDSCRMLYQDRACRRLGQLRGEKRMKGHGRRIGLMVTMVALLLLTATAVWAQQPKSGGTLQVAWEADLTGIDPHVSPGLQAYRVVGNLFNGLLTTDAAMNFVPELAESWE